MENTLKIYGCQNLTTLENIELTCTWILKNGTLIDNYMGSFYKVLKNITITDEDITNLLLTMDQFAMVGTPSIYSLDELIAEYKEEFLNENYYTAYYEFLSDKLEEICMNKFD